MRTAQALRMVWIDAFVEWRPNGILRRANLMAAWGISPPQASIDLTAFRSAFPNRLEYDLRKKGYRPADGSAAIFSPDQHRAALAAHIVARDAADRLAQARHG